MDQKLIKSNKLSIFILFCLANTKNFDTWEFWVELIRILTIFTPPPPRKNFSIRLWSSWITNPDFRFRFLSYKTLTIVDVSLINQTKNKIRQLRGVHCLALHYLWVSLNFRVIGQFWADYQCFVIRLFWAVHHF